MRICFILLFSLSMLSLPALYRACGKGLRLDKIWKTEVAAKGRLEEEIAFFIDQDYHYINQGTQSYVFESEDGKYILKLFKFEQPSNSLYRFYRQKLRQRPLRLPIETQKKKTFAACRIAEQIAKDETGLIALHLEQTKGLPFVRFHLPMGRSWSVSMDDLCFILQRKADLISSALADKNGKDAKIKLQSLYSLLKKRSEKGIINLDSNFNRNFGYLGNRAVEIDFGGYAMGNQEEVERDFDRFSITVKKWLEKKKPEWVSYWGELSHE